MKKFKKIVSLMLALVMCFSFSAVSFAADGDYTITIENATIGADYSAYKIFDATYDEASGGVSYTISSSSTFYESIEKMSSVFVLTEIEGTDNYYVTTVENVTDEDVIALIASLDFSGVTASASTGDNGATSTTLVLDVGEPGYYYVTSSLGAVVTITTAAPAATVIDKNEVVGGDKFHKYTTDSDGNEVQSADIALGEELNFDITSNVPLYAGDEIVTEYQFTDTLGDTGLEIEIEVEPTDGSKHIETSTDDSGATHYFADASLINQFVTLTDTNGDTYYLVDGEVDGVEVTGVAYNVTLEFTGVREETINGSTYVVCGGFILTYYTYDVDSYVEGDAETFDTSNYHTDLIIDIKYSTYVTDNANHTETNTATLDYWTIPYRTIPTPENPPTPADSQYSTDTMYDWDLKIIKVDGNDDTHYLEGAEFTLVGTNLNHVKVSTTVTYTLHAGELEEGVTYYYLTAEGRYITTAPASDGSDADQYDSEHPGPYVRSIDTNVVEDASDETHTAYGETASDGTLIFDGLSSGTYTLTEIVAPDGYNLLDDPIEIVVSFDSESGTFTADLGDSMLDGGNGYFLTELEDGELVITIANNTGAELPSTGGMGTTIFYVIGAVLVCGAAVLLITRRRMSHAA